MLRPTWEPCRHGATPSVPASRDAADHCPAASPTCFGGNRDE